MYIYIILLLLCIFLLLLKKDDIFELNKNMKLQRYNHNIIIIDNFYKYPDKVRKYALKQKYTPHMSIYKTMYNNPSFIYENHRHFVKDLEKIESKHIDTSIWNQNVSKESNGYFQYLTKNDNPIIHTDTSLRSLIVYLSKTPASNSGITFYKHKSTNQFKEQKNISNDVKNKNAWVSHFDCKNVYNRAIIFDGNMYHASQGGFGDSKGNSRLYQTFFYKFKA